MVPCVKIPSAKDNILQFEKIRDQPLRISMHKLNQNDPDAVQIAEFG